MEHAYGFSMNTHTLYALYVTQLLYVMMLSPTFQHFPSELCVSEILFRPVESSLLLWSEIQREEESRGVDA